MPAGFNKGQIEYIKTIANVNGHKSYKSTIAASQAHSPINGFQPTVDNHCRVKLYCLGDKPLTLPTGSVDADTDLVYESDLTSLDVYNVPIEADQSAATANNRVTPECFLESINLKMRQIIDLDVTEDPYSHKEFRLIVFRHKEKQHSSKQLAENFSNPFYDMYHGAGNLKYGPKGYRKSMDNAGTIDYASWPSYQNKYDRDAMLTDPMNKDDYVVMKDCRYYLGREYGGKHIYEDRFHWDHEDPIATDHADLSYCDSNKNYCWYIMLIATLNQVNSSTAVDNFGYIRLAANTHVTSG